MGFGLERSLFISINLLIDNYYINHEKRMDYWSYFLITVIGFANYLFFMSNSSLKKLDPKACGTIEYERYQNDCYTIVAINNSNSSLCEIISN